MIHIILTCTSTKNVVIPDYLKFRNIQGKTQKELFDKWFERIEQHPNKHYAVEMYSGFEYLHKEINRYGGILWIASAGLGILKPFDLIPPYSITFNHRWEDGVRRGFRAQYAEREWWKMLTNKTGLCLSDLAKQHTDDTFIFSCSEAYYPALINDISEASIYANQSLFVSRWLGGEFTGTKMPIDKRIIPLIGSTEYNIAACYALFCLKKLNTGYSVSDIRTIVQDYLDQAPKTPRKKILRKKISDNEIVEYIQTNPNLTVAQITNKIRKDGFSCGSDRFDRISRNIGYKM